MSNTAFRGFGGPQGIFIAESFMSEVADRLDISVEKLREINFYKPNEETVCPVSFLIWHIFRRLGRADISLE
jgi:xanthine dehydrogenase/oxidase